MGRIPMAMCWVLLAALSQTRAAIDAMDLYNITFFLGDTKAPQLTEAAGLDSCRASLLEFYNSSKQLSELAPSQWQESQMDSILCKAGLWGCPRPTQMEPAVHACDRKDNSTVSVAFIIMASDNSWKGAPHISVLEELLQLLDHPGFHILIHVDQNSSPDFQSSVTKLADHQSNVALVSYSLACAWAGASITAGQLSALADVHYRLNSSCIDLVINLSNSDFPVKGAKAIQRQLAASVGHVHFDYFPKEGSNDTFHEGPDPEINPKDADMFNLPECWDRPVSIRRQDLHPHHAFRRHQELSDWQMVISSQFWILSRAAVEYLVNDLHVAYLWHYLQHTPVTDESFFSTAIYNHPQLNSTIREGAFKYVGKRHQGRLIRDSSEKELMTCKYLFARKFMTGSEALRLTNSSRTLCTA